MLVFKIVKSLQCILNKLKANEDPEKTSSLPDLSNNLTEPQILDFSDIKQAEDDNINNTTETHICNLPKQVISDEEITPLTLS